MVIRKSKDVGEQKAKEEIEVGKIAQQNLLRKAEEKYLSANFYFSVVFASQEERDNWCKQHNLKLRDNDYIFASDLKKLIKE